jgi:hypothetical protein
MFHLKFPLYAKVTRTKKRATILLQSNHVGSFDCHCTLMAQTLIYDIHKADKYSLTCKLETHGS